MYPSYFLSFGVKRVTQAVAQQGEAQHGQCDHQRWEEQLIWIEHKVLLRGAEASAPQLVSGG